MSSFIIGLLCLVILGVAFGLPYLLLHNEIKALQERYRRGLEADDELKHKIARIDAPSPLDEHSLDNVRSLHERTRKPWPE